MGPDRSKAPYLPQDAVEVGNVLQAMNDHSKRGKNRDGGFTVKKKTFTLANGHEVDSWQCQDWDYKKPNLPTYARGLFTHNNSKGKPEIAVRGYDKFFNVGEVSNTQWRNVEHNTRGPYELSVKENGCIIFIAGLDDETLIVTSKHSVGPRQDNSANHAKVGEQWVDKQLASLGRSKGDLAKKLREMNATAVAELCDDEFEEHVLEYTPETAGLYLHGINLNLPEFATYPGNLVHKFADEWGFKKVQYFMEDDINKVKTFLEQVAETGNYAGRNTEGFVIRCQTRDGPKGEWHDWFFKYKFEEPYLMYRQWREVTKAVIAGKLPKYKKHKKITEEYLAYARRQLAKDPKIGAQFNKNHGIIAMREGFLNQKGVKGSDIIRSEMQDGSTESIDVTKNVVLIPVATIGCGKTTVAIALAKLFGWGHEQNDNIQGRDKRPQRFAMACTNSLTAHGVMIADRNNHQRRERQQIIQDIQNLVPDAKFVALHYVHDRGNYSDIRKATQSRVLTRGDNHQTIQAGSKSADEIKGIMEGFLHRFEPVDTNKPPDDDFDLVINLDVTATSRENLETVVHNLHDQYPKLFTMPTDVEMDDALNSALNDYQPDIKHDLSSKPNGANRKENNHQTHKAAAKLARQQREPLSAQFGDPPATSPAHPSKQPSKSKPLEYFCISLPTARITAILDAVFSESAETSKFYNQLKEDRRVQNTFHVTLLHRANSKEHKEYWDKLSAMWHAKNREQPTQNGHKADDREAVEAGDLGSSRVQLERVVWDERVMCVVARLVDAGKDGFETVNEMAHVTVGTAAEGIKPKESNELLKRWIAGGVGGEEEERQGKVWEVKIKGNVVVEGRVRGVLGR